jgi:hypothetical protein
MTDDGPSCVNGPAACAASPASPADFRCPVSRWRCSRRCGAHFRSPGELPMAAAVRRQGGSRRSHGRRGCRPRRIDCRPQSLASRRAKHPKRGVNGTTTKYFALLEFGFLLGITHSGPRERAYRDRHERGPGGGGRGSHRRERLRRADNRERGRRAHDRCDRRTAKSCRPGARGLCAKSCGDVCCPTGPRASAIRRATGAIVHRSPGRTRHKPFQPLRREGRDAPVALFPAVQCSAICPWHSGAIGASRLPVFPAPSFN